MRPRPAGFTLVELLVVMAIVALLLTIAAPRYFASIERSREGVARQDLFLMREALDRFYGDHGHYPESLGVLVERKYLRRIPVDPLTGRADSWTTLASDDPDKPGIADIRSGAAGRARDGTAYRDW